MDDDRQVQINPAEQRPYVYAPTYGELFHNAAEIFVKLKNSSFTLLENANTVFCAEQTQTTLNISDVVVGVQYILFSNSF